MMKRYRIYYRNKCIECEAETPKKAIKSLYKNINISIIESKNGSYKVELIDSERKSIHYYNIESSLNRKNKPNNYIEPMPKNLLHKLVKEFKKDGGIIIMDEETDKYLDSKNAEGITYNESTILLKQNPSRSVVYEELFHAKQFREGKNNGSYEQKLLCEIEAQKMLIKNKNKLDITDIEDKQTKLALKAYEKEYKEYCKNKNK